MPTTPPPPCFAPSIEALDHLAMRFHRVTVEYQQLAAHWPHPWRASCVVLINPHRAQSRMEGYGPTAQAAIAELFRAIAAGEGAQLDQAHA